MTAKTGKSKVTKSLVNLLLIVPSIINIIGSISLLFKTDARGSIRSMVIILLMSLFIVSLMVTTWMCLLAIIFIYFTSLQMSLMLSLSIILILNLLLMIIFILLVSKIKENIGFPQTTELLNSLTKKL